MDYIYRDVDDLEGVDKVGTHQCVALIQTFTEAGNTAFWRQGKAVMGNLSLAKGTAIATFVNGKYPNKAHGNHAAFFLRFEGNGIWVMDQWARANKRTVSSRYIRAKTSDQGNPTENANNYSVIE